MDIIRSWDNKTVKHTAKLKQKKYRDEYGEFFVEGYKNALDTCNARPELVKYVLVSESAYKKSEIMGAFSPFDVTVISNAVFARLSETESAQGVMSVNGKPPATFPSSDRCILLDRVRDPGNVGTILRTAVACDYDVVTNNCADIYSPKVTRSAMSAIIKCRIGENISPGDLKKAGYELLVADMHGDNVFDAARPTKYCVVIGNEAEGVSEDIKAEADRLLAVPQSNMESLNAAVAAAVMMFGLRYVAGADKSR